MIASTRLLSLIFLFKKVFLLRFWLVQSENTFLTLSWEVKANTQFFRVRSAITPKFVRETIASKIWKSSLCSFSSTTTFQACLTEHREDIRRWNVLGQSMACLWNIGKWSPKMCLNPVQLLKCRTETGASNPLKSSRVSFILLIWPSLPESSASATTSAPRTVFKNTPLASAMFC